MRDQPSILWVSTSRFPRTPDPIFDRFSRDLPVDRLALSLTDSRLGDQAARRLRAALSEGPLAFVLDLRGTIAQPPAWLTRHVEQPLVVVADDTRHAIRAHDLGAVDYLVVEPGRDEIEAQVTRALGRVRNRAADPLELAAGLRQWVESDEASEDHQATDTYLRRILVAHGRTRHLLPVREIFAIRAKSNYVAIETAERTFVKRIHLGELASRLDPQKFLRVHRSALVNAEQIDHLKPAHGTSWLLFLRNGHRVTVSRRAWRTVVRPFLENDEAARA